MPRPIRRSSAALFLALPFWATGCLNRLNVTAESLARLDVADGIVFGRFTVAAPPDLADDIPASGGILETSDGAIAKVENASDGTRYRFRVPPDGEFRWALPEGDYRITHWTGLLRDGPRERIEAHLSLEAIVTVRRAAVTAAGEIRFDGSVLSAAPASDAAVAEFRAGLPEFEGAVVSTPARAIGARPPVEIIRISNPGGGDDGCSHAPHILTVPRNLRNAVATGEAVRSAL